MPEKLTSNAGTGAKILENWDRFRYELCNNESDMGKFYKFNVWFGEQSGYMTVSIKEGIISQNTTINLDGFDRPLGAYNDTSLSGYHEGLCAVAERMLRTLKLVPFDN